MSNYIESDSTHDYRSGERLSPGRPILVGATNFCENGSLPDVNLHRKTAEIGLTGCAGIRIWSVHCKSSAKFECAAMLIIIHASIDFWYLTKIDVPLVPSRVYLKRVLWKSVYIIERQIIWKCVHNTVFILIHRERKSKLLLRHKQRCWCWNLIEAVIIMQHHILRYWYNCIAGFAPASQTQAQSFAKVEIQASRNQQKEADAKLKEQQGQSGPPIPNWAGKPPLGVCVKVLKSGTIVDRVSLTKPMTVFGRWVRNLNTNYSHVLHVLHSQWSNKFPGHYDSLSFENLFI